MTSTNGVTRRVTVYAARANPSPAPLFNLYSELTGVQVEAIYGSFGPIAKRLADERTTPQADVVISKTRPDLDTVREAGLLEPYASSIARELPDWLHADDFSWTSFSGWPRVAIVNRAVLPNPVDWPMRLDELAEPSWRGRFGCASILERTTRAHFAAIHAARGADYLECLLDRLVANDIRIFLGNTGGRIDMMRTGLPVALASCSNIHIFYREGHPVGEAWLDQEDGGLGAHVEAHSMGIVRDCPRPEAARDFVDFMLSVEAQTFLAKQFGETPVNPAADHGEVRPLADIRRIDASLAAINQAMPSTLAMLRTRGFELEETAVRTGPA